MVAKGVLFTQLPQMLRCFFHTSIKMIKIMKLTLI